MLKELLSNRLVLGGLACLVLIVVGCTLYLTHVERENAADVPWEETAEAERLAKELLADWNDYTQTLQEKYPDIFDPDVLQKTAQTKKGRAALKLQFESMLEETLDEFERLFNQLPKEFAHAVLDVLEVELQQNPQGLSPEYIQRALSLMRARID